METQIKYPRNFKRGYIFFLPKGILIFIFFVVFWGAMGNILAGNWLWGMIRLFLAGFLVWSYRWLHVTPIVRFDNNELTINHYQFFGYKKVPYKMIENVDEPRPSCIRISLKNNNVVIIQKHWFDWNDRQPFLSMLKAHVEK